VRIGIVGAGFGGLAAAYDLARMGHEVTVVEAASVPGGLASGFRDEAWEWPLERFYHHLFTSDADILDLARETGFGEHLLTRRPITASWFPDGIYALDGVVPVLRFPGVPFIDRVRLGLVILYLKLTRDWRKLEHVTAADWVRRWMGRRVYETIWQPLLLGKFGPHHDQVPMSWLWARLHKRSMRLMYFRGGFQAFADHLTEVVRAAGAQVHLGVRVTGIRGSTSGPVLTSDRGEETFDKLIVTTGPHLLARLAPELPPDYLGGLDKLVHLGAIVVVLALRQPILPEVYWLSMDKRRFPFLALVEHTNFMPADHYGGDRLVYLGDYLPPDHRAFGLSDAELLDEWLPPLTQINPRFDRAWIRKAWVFRAAYAQPVVPLGFSKYIPPLETPIPGVILASMSQVYPWDRGTNYAVEIGRRAARAVAG
jgi:protoporphyrinogen oxidase